MGSRESDTTEQVSPAHTYSLCTHTRKHTHQYTYDFIDIIALDVTFDSLNNAPPQRCPTSWNLGLLPSLVIRAF